MTRIAAQQHPLLSLDAGDTVIYSARKIPGNERNIAGMYDALIEQGVDIVDERSACVHTSGHAQHDELLELYDLTKPALAIPGLGSRMLRQLHANLLMEHGREPGDIVMLENGLGTELSITAEGEIDYRLTAPIATELCALESQGYRIDDELLDERQRLATEGVLSISVSLTEKLDRSGSIQLEEAGLHPERYHEDLEDALCERLERAIDSFPTSKGPRTPHSIERLRLFFYWIAYRYMSTYTCNVHICVRTTSNIYEWCIHLHCLDQISRRVLQVAASRTDRAYVTSSFVIWTPALYTPFTSHARSPPQFCG